MFLSEGACMPAYKTARFPLWLQVAYVWLICLVEYLIHSHCWAHMVQASLYTLGSMKCPYSHSCGGPGSQSWTKTWITLPQTQPICCLHYKLDTAWQRGEDCVRSVLFSFEVLCSPKDNLSLWGPQWPQTLLFVGVYLCVVNAYMSRQEGVWVCV